MHEAMIIQRQFPGAMLYIAADLNAVLGGAGRKTDSEGNVLVGNFGLGTRNRRPCYV